MSTSDSIEALRRANLRAEAGFAQLVDAAAEAVRERIDALAPVLPDERPRRRVRLVGISAGASLAAAAALVAIVLAGSPGGGPGVENAAAAFEEAATLTAAAAERSGTASVRITHDGELWAGSTIRWHGANLETSRTVPSRHRKAGREFLVVDGMMYGIDPGDGGWVELGSPKSIDPGSGTTPDETLAAAREDVGGTTLRRFTDSMTGLNSERLDDGSTVYRGKVAAGVIARETGFKEGQAIRVLPFGYVAHDEAADANALLDVAVTAGADNVLRQIAVTWGTWTYRVAYSKLGATASPRAPKDARPFPDRRP
jgi:hypothetical protein